MVSDTVAKLEQAVHRMAIRLEQVEQENKRLLKQATAQSIEIQKQNDEIISLREKINASVSEMDSLTAELDSLIATYKNE